MQISNSSIRSLLEAIKKRLVVFVVAFSIIFGVFFYLSAGVPKESQIQSKIYIDEIAMAYFALPYDLNKSFGSLMRIKINDIVSREISNPNTQIYFNNNSKITIEKFEFSPIASAVIYIKKLSEKTYRIKHNESVIICNIGSACKPPSLELEISISKINIPINSGLALNISTVPEIQRMIGIAFQASSPKGPYHGIFTFSLRNITGKNAFEQVEQSRLDLIDNLRELMRQRIILRALAMKDLVPNFVFIDPEGRAYWKSNVLIKSNDKNRKKELQEIFQKLHDITITNFQEKFNHIYFQDGSLLDVKYNVNNFDASNDLQKQMFHELSQVPLPEKTKLTEEYLSEMNNAIYSLAKTEIGNELGKLHNLDHLIYKHGDLYQVDITNGRAEALLLIFNIIVSFFGALILIALYDSKVVTSLLGTCGK